MDIFEMVSNYCIVFESHIWSKSKRDPDSEQKNTQTNVRATILSLSMFDVTFSCIHIYFDVNANSQVESSLSFSLTWCEKTCKRHLHPPMMESTMLQVWQKPHKTKKIGKRVLKAIAIIEWGFLHRYKSRDVKTFFGKTAFSRNGSTFSFFSTHKNWIWNWNQFDVYSPQEHGRNGAKFSERETLLI